MNLRQIVFSNLWALFLIFLLLERIEQGMNDIIKLKNYN